MGSPYLSSGEAIVLTTNRVSADSVPYDVMLTSERIFLFDNRNARFEPLIIPLNTILSVQGGKTPTHDPVITLLFRSEEVGGARQPLNLVFSQNPNENRKAERDDWIRNLIQLSINQHEKEAVPEPPVIPDVTGETGLRPAVRHSVAPEKVRPLSHVAERRTVPVPVTVIPDKAEGSGEMPARKKTITPSEERHFTTEPVQQEPAPEFIPVRGSPSRLPDPPARVVIPQIIEEQLPVQVRTVVPAEQEPAPQEETGPWDHATATPDPSLVLTEKPEPLPPPLTEPAITPAPGVETGREPPAAVSPAEQEPAPQVDSGPWDHATATPDPSLALTEKPEPLPPPLTEPAITPVVPVAETGREPPAAVLPAAAEGSRGMAEILSALQTGTGEPVTTEQADTATSDTIPEKVMEEPVRHPITGVVSRPEPVPAEAPPDRHPIPPSQGIRPLRTTLVYAAVLLIALAVIAAVAVLLVPLEPESPAGPSIPSTPGIVPVTTSSPVTVQPTPESMGTPQITAIGLSLPLSVPLEGVWVGVNSTSNYTGRVGNTGFMQPFSGSGNNYYKISGSNRTVQVSVQKLDNSGALLAVAIYRNGTLISTSSVTSPKGTIEMLIDPLTARAPGLTGGESRAEYAAPPTGLENY